MSVDRDAGDGDRGAGRVGLPVDAVCTGCTRTSIKRTSAPEAGDPASIAASDLTSFESECESCETKTWWNPVAVLSGLIKSQSEDKNE